MNDQPSINQQLGHITVEESTAAYATPLAPEIVSAILRDPDSPLYPSRIAVFCDECGFTESGEYMVSEEQTKAERLEVARAHLRKRGWQCDEDGDFCREHASSPVEETPAAAAPRTFTPDVVTVNADGRKHTTGKMKRACNGCGRHIGDVTDQEMACGVNVLPLPDVRRECPDCGPTAPEPKCLPTAVLRGEPKCLDAECTHEHSAEDGSDPVEDSYCDEVTEQTICVTHSAFDITGTITRTAAWPCTAPAAVETGE